MTRHRAGAEGNIAGNTTATEGAERATFCDVFGVTEFRALWLAQLLSVIGDQLARVALTVLVYSRTGSAALAAVTYVCSIVPTFAGGVLFGSLADRYPRRTVMIVCDLIRFALVLVMAIHGMPLVVLVVLLFWVTFAGAPFLAARAAVYPAVLDGDRYVVGTAITLTTSQFAQVLGFAAGGVLAGILGTSGALLADAATFALSALIVLHRVASRPAPAPATDEGPGIAAPAASSTSAGRRRALSRLGGRISLVFGNPALRIPMLFGWLTAFYDAPEGVVIPLARSLGGGPVAVGVLLASQAFGVTLGSLLFSRLVAPTKRLAWMGPLAVACTATLCAFALLPPLAGAMVILAASGGCAAYQLAANAAFVQAVPDGRRSQAFGLAQGGISLGQGTLMILAGVAAQAISPPAVVAICGAAGTATAIVLTAAWSRQLVSSRNRYARWCSFHGPADRYALTVAA